MARSYGCAWCPAVAPTATAHMLHVHDAHPERVGVGARGDARSRRPYTCRACAADIPADVTACACGWSQENHGKVSTT